MTLHVHIDRVVIDAAADGPALDRARLEEAIRGELAERIAAEGLPAQLRASSAHDAIVGGAGRPREVATRDRNHGIGTRRPAGQGIGHALYGSFHR
jgi:hypothetical protein